MSLSKIISWIVLFWILISGLMIIFDFLNGSISSTSFITGLILMFLILYQSAKLIMSGD